MSVVTATSFAPAPSMARLFAIELRKTVDTRAGFWLLATSALAIAAVVALPLVADHPQHVQLSVFFERTIKSAGVLLPVLGLLAITSEWSQRTALTTFALVPRRERVIAGKLLAGLALALAAVAVCLVTSVAATALAPVVGRGAGRWDLTTGGVAAAALYTTMWMLAGAALGLLVMRSAPAIVVSFLVPMGIVALAAGLPGAADALRWIDLGTTSRALADAPLAISGQDWAQIATGFAVWVLLPLGVGFVRLHHRDVASS